MSARVTRRQSGKFPQPKRLKTQPIELDFSESDYGSEESLEESDGSDYEQTKTKKKGTRITSKGKAKNVAKLSILPTLSVDILLEIFNYLSSKDLLSLARTTKSFRSFLMNRNAQATWRNARGPAPECPERMTEPAWAELLFGGSKCQLCGSKTVQKVDFYLRKRLCTGCRKDNLVYHVKFASKFPDFDPVIMELIPYSNVGGWAQGHASRSKFFWEDDIYAMAKKLGFYQKNVNMRIPGAQGALDRFKRSEEDFVKSILEHAVRCNRWENHLARDRIALIQSQRLERRVGLIARFVELGYTAGDFNSACTHYKTSDYENTAPMSDRIWNRLRPLIEPAVEERRRMRIAISRSLQMDARKQLCKGLYQEYQRSLTPLLWSQLPPEKIIYRAADFAKLIYEDSDRLIQVEDFSNAAGTFGDITRKHREDVTNHLLGLLRDYYKHPLSIEPPIPQDDNFVVDQDKARAVEGVSVDILDRTLSVFSCQTCRTSYFGLSQTIAHSCSNTSLHVDSSNRAALVGIFKSLNIPHADQGKITWMEMDEQYGAERFVCEANNSCKPSNHCGNVALRGRRVYNWKMAVRHASQAHSYYTPPAFRLLSADERLKLHTVAVQESTGWTCNLCPVNFESTATKSEVLKHAQEAHQIQNPRIPEDVFHDLRCITDWELEHQIYLIPHKAPKAREKRPPPQRNPDEFNHNCFVCTGKQRNRPFNCLGVISHIKAKHQISSPVEGTHHGLVGSQPGPASTLHQQNLTVTHQAGGTR